MNMERAFMVLSEVVCQGASALFMVAPSWIMGIMSAKSNADVGLL